MKKFLLVFALFIGVSSFYSTTNAQNINISINIGRQPAWGPVGYDYVGYYYFPDIDCYYDVNSGTFVYLNHGRWMSARYLPRAYRHYDLYGMYKVVLNTHNPWMHHHVHYRDYARYRGHRHQVVIRDSRDYKYRDSRNNRVTWYSDSRKATNRNNRYESSKQRDNRYENNRNSSNNRNNNSQRPAYNSNGNNRAKQQEKSTNYNNSRSSSSRDNSRSREAKPTRSTSNKKSEFRMASNSNQSTRSR